MATPRIKGRLLFPSLLFLFGFIFVGGLLFKLQVVEGRRYRRVADEMFYKRRQEIPAERGAIYDRKGNLLAYSEITGVLFGQWEVLKGNALRKACLLIGNYFPQIRDSIKDLMRKKSEVLRGIRYETGKDFISVLKRETLSFAIGVRKEYKRHYPFPYFSNVLGRVSETERKGLWGLEKVLDEYLKGKDGFIVYQKDALGNLFPFPSYPRAEPKKGCDVYLTLDKDITEVSFEELQRGVEEFSAKKGAVLVLDCATGAVLAIVDYPLWEKEAGYLRPYSLLWEFEPGSVFKFLIASACLVSEDSLKFLARRYDVSSGEVAIGKHRIREYKRRRMGILSFADIFARSSNCGVALLSFLVPKEDYYSLLCDFGIGSFTGIELEERRGFIPALSYLEEKKDVPQILYATNCFGQGLRTTLLGLANAYLTIAQGGLLLRPFVIKEIRRDGKIIFRGERVAVRRVLSEGAAERLKDILHSVCEAGTGRQAAITGSATCGKTGTAQKPAPGGYSDKTVNTFIGFYPKESPRYLIAVMLDEPVGPAGENAAIIFKRIGERLRLLSNLLALKENR